MSKMWEPVSDGRASLVQIGSKKNCYALMAPIQILNSKTPFNNQLTRTVFLL